MLAGRALAPTLVREQVEFLVNDAHAEPLCTESGLGLRQDFGSGRGTDATSRSNCYRSTITPEPTVSVLGTANLLRVGLAADTGNQREMVLVPRAVNGTDAIRQYGAPSTRLDVDGSKAPRPERYGNRTIGHSGEFPYAWATMLAAFDDDVESRRALDARIGACDSPRARRDRGPADGPRNRRRIDLDEAAAALSSPATKDMCDWCSIFDDPIIASAIVDHQNSRRKG